VSRHHKSTWRQRIVPDQLGNAIIVSTHGTGSTVVVEISESDGNVAGVRLLHDAAVDHAVQVANACASVRPEEAVTGVDGEALRVWCRADGRVCFQVGDAFIVLRSDAAERHVSNVLAAANAYGDGDDER
jgi:hypothetical protein